MAVVVLGDWSPRELPGNVLEEANVLDINHI